MIGRLLTPNRHVLDANQVCIMHACHLVRLAKFQKGIASFFICAIFSSSQRRVQQPESEVSALGYNNTKL